MNYEENKERDYVIDRTGAKSREEQKTGNEINDKLKSQTTEVCGHVDELDEVLDVGVQEKIEGKLTRGGGGVEWYELLTGIKRRVEQT